MREFMPVPSTFYFMWDSNTHYRRSIRVNYYSWTQSSVTTLEAKWEQTKPVQALVICNSRQSWLEFLIITEQTMSVSLFQANLSNTVYEEQG